MLAALLNAVRLVDKAIGGLRVVIAGAAAAGVAVTKILQAEGVEDVTVCDRKARSTPAGRRWTNPSAGLPPTPTRTAAPARSRRS